MRPVEGGFLVKAALTASTARLPVKGKAPVILNDLGFEGDMTLDAAFQSLHIEKSKVTWGDLASFDLSGDLSKLKTAQDVEIRIASGRIDLAPMIERIMMLGLMPITGDGGGMPVARMVNGSIGLESEIEGSLRRPSSIAVSGRIALQEVTAGHPVLDKPITASGYIDFDMQGASSDKVAIRFGSSSAEIGFDVTLDERKKVGLMKVACGAALDLEDVIPAERRGELGMGGGSVKLDVSFEGSPGDLETLFPMIGDEKPASEIERAWEQSRLTAA